MSRFNWWVRACAPFLLWVTAAVALPAQTFKTLHSFDGTDGYAPNGALLQGTDGNLYGTTALGGANDYGTVFKITPSGTLTTLHSFDNTDGATPFAALIQGTDGNFYGTTSNGGAYSCEAQGLCGTVFKITPSGTLTTLHSFDGTDGYAPQAGLVQGTNGNFYGTTVFGGANDYGTVFKITPSGKLTTLHNFGGTETDGAYPYATPVQGTNGNFYGITFSGGAAFEGTFYKITPSGAPTTLYSFCSGNPPCPDGGNPLGGLVQGTNGNFYGTVARGGNNACTFNGFDGCGTVFKITPSGTLTTLHRFDGTDGAGPLSNPRLGEGTDGNFYGTTLGEGANGYGTIFKITPSGTLTTLHSFDNTDGADPEAALIQGTNGTFYGTTPDGANTNGYCPSGCGTVFSLYVGLGPFVETQPTSGAVGKAVKILGTNLTSATSVTFNGTAAKFKVVSKSEIKTTVPVGATSGKVKVKTPGGTLTSNVDFRVTK